MRKLTEGDGGSWVNLSSKSSQSRPIPISSSPRQESFSPWPCLPLCLWRKDGARLSMIGDGHYLNTILEPGPTPLANAVRLETTLMRREMMGQPATPSAFINSDKMVSTLPKFPATSINIDFFTMCHSAFVDTVSLHYLFISSPYFGFIGYLYSARGIAFPVFASQRPCVSLFNILSLPFVCLAEGSLCEWVMFVLANLLLFKRLTPVRQWIDWQDLKMLRTVLSCPTPAGREEWGLLAGSVWQATGEGLSGGISRPQSSALHFTCKWSQKIPLCPWTRSCKTLKSQDTCVVRNTQRDGETWTHRDRQKKVGISISDHCKVVIKSWQGIDLNCFFFFLFWRAPWLGLSIRQDKKNRQKLQQTISHKFPPNVLC